MVYCTVYVEKCITKSNLKTWWDWVVTGQLNDLKIGTITADKLL